jgi:hypothetical protein
MIPGPAQLLSQGCTRCNISTPSTGALPASRRVSPHLQDHLCAPGAAKAEAGAGGAEALLSTSRVQADGCGHRRQGRAGNHTPGNGWGDATAGGCGSGVDTSRAGHKLVARRLRPLGPPADSSHTHVTVPHIVLRSRAHLTREKNCSMICLATATRGLRRRGVRSFCRQAVREVPPDNTH